MGQIAGELKNRQQGSLPSNTEAPRNLGSSSKEQCQMVTIQSGKPLTEHPRPEKKDLAKRPIDNSIDQSTNQPTNNHSPEKEKEHSSTHDKQDDALRISSRILPQQMHHLTCDHCPIRRG